MDSEGANMLHDGFQMFVRYGHFAPVQNQSWQESMKTKMNLISPQLTLSRTQNLFYEVNSTLFLHLNQINLCPSCPIVLSSELVVVRESTGHPGLFNFCTVFIMKGNWFYYNYIAVYSTSATEVLYALQLAPLPSFLVTLRIVSSSLHWFLLLVNLSA